MLFWLLNFFPDILAHLMVFLGVVFFIAATFLGMIPFINQYKIPAQLLGVLLFASGLYLEGGISYKESINAKVAELEQKLADAEIKAAKTNVQIVEKIVVQKQLVKTKGDTVIKYIETNKETIDKACVIPPDVIDAHNKAATLIDTKEPTKPNKPLSLLPKRTDNR